MFLFYFTYFTDLFCRLFMPPSTDDASHDEALSSRVAALNMLDLGLRHLGIDVVETEGAGDELDVVVNACGEMLGQLDNCFCPGDKAAILVAAHKIVVDGLSRLPPIRLISEEEQAQELERKKVEEGEEEDPKTARPFSSTQSQSQSQAQAQSQPQSDKPNTTSSSSTSLPIDISSPSNASSRSEATAWSQPSPMPPHPVTSPPETAVSPLPSDLEKTADSAQHLAVPNASQALSASSNGSSKHVPPPLTLPSTTQPQSSPPAPAPAPSSTLLTSPPPNPKPTPVSGDVLFPLIIFSVVKSNPPHLVSHLLFTQRYRNQSVGGEESYCLINLMAVAEFVENVDLAGLGLGGGRVMSIADLSPIPLTRSPVTSETPLAPSSSSTNDGHAAHETIRGRVEQQVDAIADSANKVISGVVDSSFGILRSFMPVGGASGSSGTNAGGVNAGGGVGAGGVGGTGVGGQGGTPAIAIPRSYSIPGTPKSEYGELKVGSAASSVTGPGSGGGAFGLLRKESGFSIASLAASLPIPAAVSRGRSG
ncbi:hypothetical protein CVT24_001161, partial [Panaeolus cyanescens]